MKKVSNFNDSEEILVNYIFYVILYMIYQVVEILIWYCTRLFPKSDFEYIENRVAILQ